jgi:hypothetical protein
MTTKKFTIFYMMVLLIISCTMVHAQNWLTVGTGVNNNVYGFTKDTVNNVLYVSGRFTDASGTTANRVAKWNGSSWSNVGSGFDSDVNAIYYDHNSTTLYAGGSFTFSGITPITRIAKWDGTTWSALGSGCDNTVLAINGDGAGNIYAGGSFTTAGGVSAARIARWNGTSWNALGSGIGTGSNYVEALTFYNGNLIAGGQFTTAGSVTANSVAGWNGTAWFALNGGVAGLSVRVSAFKEVNGELICGGTFSSAGGVASNSLAKWNGATWIAFPGGITGGQAKIKSLGYLFNTLYVGGNFSLAGTVAVNSVAAYDGSVWTDLNGGVNNQVDALMNYGNEMYAGGAFTTAGGSSASFIARWRNSCLTNATITTTSTSCFGVCNATATVSATGNNPFTYQWSTSPTQTGNTAVDLCAGSYTVTITDNVGCSIQQTAVISEPAQLAISFSSNNPTCYEVCNGNALASNNGQGNITYAWNTIPVQTTQTALNLCAGTYTVLITDSAGCSLSDSVTITAPAANVLSIIGTNPVCNNTCDGIATVVSTGVAPFQYLWNTIPAQTLDSAVNLCAGIYSVTVTDDIGCSVTDSITLINPVANTLLFTTAPTTCFNSCDGTATVTTTGAFPFSYVWNTIPVQTAAAATGLCAGIYEVTVTDSNNCVVIDSIEVTQPAPNELTFTTQNARCNVACNGGAAVLSSGQFPFAYNWSNGNNTDSISNLCAAVYIVTVTDDNGCSATDSVVVANDAPLPIDFTNAYSGCNGVCIGASSADISGLSGLTFFWSTGETGSSIDSLCPGFYAVTITDLLGCVVSDSTEIINLPVFINPSVTSPTCVGLCDGAVSINPVGTAPFQWEWSTGDTTSLSLTGLCAGTYSVSVSDNAGCVGNESIIVNDPPAILYQASHTDATCAGLCDGISSITATGNGALTYEWNTIPVQTTAAVSNLCFGYTPFTITDSLGCYVTDSVLIFEPSPLFLGSNILQINCNGNCDGFVQVLPSGGTPTYAFEWSNGFIFDSILNACPGTYTVTVTDANLCTSTTSYTFIEPDPISVTFTVTDASCPGCTDGSIIASISGGTPPYLPLFTDLSIADTIATNLGTGYYTFCVKDVNNCNVCDSVFVDQGTSVQIINPSISEIKIYPNPFTKTAYLKISGKLKPEMRIQFFDITGREVYINSQQMTVSTMQQIFKIENTGLKAGLYYVKISSGNEIDGIGKFLIQ